ncbi:non-ribosomal peptide synthetase [Desulfobacca acetoxidans]|uniref:Amino acid adenylation domain protein n=1 Tax=Desulfobacca acetoxidans (strain ATCC 700848 / DSM 11109 / ASRB2) TaxID=880072 RepID=F2NDK4_DESAR|nr:non-ribosomal peptide synthetase [Desulfobacca acetoxidans]AEB10280.1 amino acid adenylation domain protein [Desulfobacca acetoxidans DSM 11109]
MMVSAAQKRLWFLQQIQPDSFGYNISGALKLTGSLDIGVLEETLYQIVRRHKFLSAEFPFRDGNPSVAFIHPPHRNLEIIDLGEIPYQSRKSEAERLMIAAVKVPFNLTSGPLLRMTLFRLSNSESILFLLLHQIICDMYAIKILLREVIEVYQSISSGASLPSPPASDYDSYSDRLPLEMGQNRIEADLSYWKNQLGNLPPLELPIDRSRPPIQTYGGAIQSVVLPGTLAKTLQSLSQREGADLSLLILGALFTLLYRYTHQPDLTVGYSLPGRTWPGSENRIDYLENFLVLRTQVSDMHSFRQLLEEIKISYREALAHQGVHFAEIVQALQVERDLSRTPFFQARYNYVSTPTIRVQLQDLLFEEVRFDPGIAPYDLSLTVWPRDDGIHCSFQYNTDLFDAPTISRLTGHFLTLLNGLATHPEEPICTLPLLTEPERHQILVEWNATETDYPKDQCIHHLFENLALQTPEAPALKFGGRQLTYQQLDASANQLAHCLKKLGIGPEVPVGICVEPSLEMMIGVIGILKAGGCYVPLDPEYPRERIAFMLEDTQTPVLLTQQSLVGQMPKLPIQTILMDKDRGRFSSENTERIASEARSDLPACIFYTSGSTGRPKGVPVPHYAINRLVLHTNYVHFQPSDRVAQASNVSFDGATFEIWGALLNGGCLIGIPKEILLSPTDLADFIRKEKINVLFLTPALFHQCAREVPDTFRPLRDLLMGGEILEPRWVRKVMQHGPPARLLNAYGPTECTTFATWYEVSEIPRENVPIPIGRPIANTSIYILDRKLQPVPIGITGELCIGGDGLALGYLRRPEQTAEKFIPDPFHPESSSRLYKTGDLARYLPDGNVEFLGRLDHQIKIRGFRIEPGEIEEALLNHAGVKEALVVAREDESGDKRLLAYVVTSREASVTSEVLRNFLRDRLPPYMIPAFFVFLDKFPLNPNGKIDRQALPIPNLADRTDARGSIGPRDAVERQLIQVWERVLGIRPIGVFDDFFALGGHSLLGARIFIQLEKLFGKKVPLYMLYQRSTVAQLAEVFRNPQLFQNIPCSFLKPINPHGPKPPLFLIDMMKSAPFLKGFLGAEQPLYNLDSPFEITDIDLIGEGISGVAARYLQEIRQVQPKGPYFLGGYSAGGLVAIEINRLLMEQGDEVALLFLLDPTPPKISRLKAAQLNYRYMVRYFFRLQPRDRLKYLQKIFLIRIKRGIALALRRANLSIPQALIKDLSREDAMFMVCKYTPQPLRTRTLLIQLSNQYSEPNFNWSNILQGPAEIRTLNVNHEELPIQPSVGIWGGYLRNNLLEVQAMISRLRRIQDSSLQ